MASVLIAFTAIFLLSTVVYGYPLDKYLKDILDAVDESADPCQDFHQFACGKWVERSCSTDQNENYFSKRDLDLQSMFRTFLGSLKDQTDLTEVEKLVRDNYELCLKSTFDEDKGEFDNEFNSTLDRVNVLVSDEESDLLYIIRFGAAIIREFGLDQEYLIVGARLSVPPNNGSVSLVVDYAKLFCDNCDNVTAEYKHEKADASVSKDVAITFLKELMQIDDNDISNMLEVYEIKFYEERKEYSKQLDRNKAKEIMVRKAKESWQKYRKHDRIEKCITFVEKHSMGAFVRAYARRELKRNLNDLKSEIDMFVNTIFGAFPLLISTNRWMPQNETVALINHVDNTRYRLTFPDWYLSEETVLANSRRFIGGLSMLSSDRRICQSLKDNLNKYLICLVTTTHGSRITYNAHYDPDDNGINFPLGPLLEPSFAAGSELQSVKFSRLGWLVGHELMHGVHMYIQSRAHQLGHSYNVSNEEVRNCVIQLYKDGLSHRNLIDNSSVTVTEDIPDIDGLKLAYLAYKFQKAVASQPLKPQMSSNFSEDQLFFLSYANNLCNCQTSKSDSDVHSLERLRVEIPAWQMSEFGKAFQCKLDSAYSTKKKCNAYSVMNLINDETVAQT